MEEDRMKPKCHLGGSKEHEAIHRTGV